MDSYNPRFYSPRPSLAERLDSIRREPFDAAAAEAGRGSNSRQSEFRPTAAEASAKRAEARCRLLAEPGGALDLAALR